jgi:hypothetical protein
VAPVQCPSMTTSTQPSEPLFSRRFLSSVTLASGAGQVVDFALPLFAGAVLGLTAAQTGALLAAGLATRSCSARSAA